MQYLETDLAILACAVLWFFWGLRTIVRVPLIHDPLVTFSRYHPRVAPFVVFLLVVFWPISKLVWKFVFSLVDELHKLRRGINK